MQTYTIRIVQADRVSVIAQRARKGSFTPDTLQSSLEKENGSWRGVLYEETDLDSGIGGDFQLPAGSYVLVLGSHTGWPVDAEAQRRMQYPLALPEELKQIALASFIVREETLDVVTQRKVKKNIGSGFFSAPRIAHTCIHNLEIQDESGQSANPVSVGDAISCVMLKEHGGKRFAVLRVAALDRTLDYAQLSSARDQPFVPLHLEDPTNLVGARVGLCTFHVGLEEELEDFDMSLSAMPGQALRVSKHQNHLMYDVDCWPGDSGAAVVIFKGKIVAMHKMGINSLREDLRKTTVDDRLTALEGSVSTFLKSMGQGAIGLLASSFPRY